MGKSTISMAIFNSYVNVYQRVYDMIYSGSSGDQKSYNIYLDETWD